MSDREDQTNEFADVHEGRLLEATTTPDGRRIFAVQIVRAGTSKNGAHYRPEVLREARELYEGAHCFDRHRTTEEIRASGIAGLVGQYRNVEARADGIYAELHMLPGAVHATEALDESLAAQAAGGKPLVGISHDVLTEVKVVPRDGRNIREATKIRQVNSADLVVDPSAGGRVTRMVAGGPGDPEQPEEGTMSGDDQTLEGFLKEFAELDDDAKAAKLEELKLTAKSEEGAPAAKSESTTEDPAPAAKADEGSEDPATEEEPVLVGATEATYERGSVMGDFMVERMTESLGDAVTAAITDSLPERFTEAELNDHVATAKAMADKIEAARIREGGPSVGHVKVGSEDADKKRSAMDGLIAGNAVDGVRPYMSLKEAYADYYGDTLRARDLITEDVALAILTEAYEGTARMSDSGLEKGRRVQRETEAVVASTFGELLGDSVTRRMIQEYNVPGLQDWRRVVSNIVPVQDFREQKRGRMGGYGVLPAVAESGAYTALTTPGDEEATYTIGKRGGTETLTMEAIANDDIGALQRIPRKLGRAAAQTLHRFVWDFLTANAATTYDATALFDATHNNTGTAALNNAGLTAVSTAMMRQAAYGDASEVLGVTPRFIIVPPELRETAFQLTNSNVAVPASGNSSDLPNLYSDMESIVIPHFVDTNDWFAIADPADVPTWEIGFYKGRQDPELFLQDMGNVGSMFDNDRVTWKIRHIYSGTILDHRGMYRNAVA